MATAGNPRPDDDDPIGVIGKTIDKYRIDELAGQGGFSVVYRGEHTVWNEPVAVKFFVGLDKAPEAVREVMLNDFMNEGKLMSRLSSRSSAIVQARDIGRFDHGDGWLAYMVLEWVNGEPLDEMLEREAEAGCPARSLTEIVTFLGPVAEAVAAAHDAEVAHRDLKPANIMIVDGGGLKVLDFGIAKVMEAKELQEQLSHTTHLLNSFSPAYGAPEQFSRKNGATGPWTDVFAVALIIVEMMQNAPVLHGSLYETAEISCDVSSRPTPRALGLEVSDEVEAVFGRALAVNVADRYKSMRQFWGDLHQAVMGAAPSSDSAFVRSLAPTSRSLAEGDTTRGAPPPTPTDLPDFATAPTNAALVDPPTLHSASYERDAASYEPDAAFEGARRVARPQRTAKLAAATLMLALGGGAALAWFGGERGGGAQKGSVAPGLADRAAAASVAPGAAAEEAPHAPPSAAAPEPPNAPERPATPVLPPPHRPAATGAPPTPPPLRRPAATGTPSAPPLAPPSATPAATQPPAPPPAPTTAAPVAAPPPPTKQKPDPFDPSGFGSRD